MRRRGLNGPFQFLFGGIDYAVTDSSLEQYGPSSSSHWRARFRAIRGRRSGLHTRGSSAKFSSETSSGNQRRKAKKLASNRKAHSHQWRSDKIKQRLSDKFKRGQQFCNQGPYAERTKFA